MNWRNGTERYGSLATWLHWWMVLLLIAVYACIDLRGFFPKGSDPREALKTWHFMLGLSVLVFASIRLIVRLRAAAPRIEPTPPRWQTMSARLMHFALYVFMFGMPLGGWLVLSAKGTLIPFFGLQLPALVGQSKELAAVIKGVHEAGGTVGYYLIGLHAVAALYHHYVVRDNTLLRMLPSGR
jgi:cytochrome b561